MKRALIVVVAGVALAAASCGAQTKTIGCPPGSHAVNKTLTTFRCEKL
jgi:hypothetical protein